MQVSPIGRQKLITREGRRKFAYPDPASPMAKRARSGQWGFKPAREILANFPKDVQALSGAPWTCGIGITGPDVNIDTRWNDAEIDRRFKVHLNEFSAGAVDALGDTPTEQHEFDAMVSLAFNIGMGWKGATKPRGAKDGFRNSTVLRLHKAGNKQGAARAFGMWNRAGGVEDRGLTNRRLEEGDQYLNGYNRVEAELPATPDPERGMAKSEINIASTTAAATALATAVTSLMDAINGKEVAILMILVAAAAGYIIWQRKRQREGGWA